MCACDGLGDGVTFVRGPVQVSSFDSGVAFVSGLEVVSVEDGVQETAEHTQRGGEYTNGALVGGVSLRCGAWPDPM